jgi:hypothetical protein
MSKKSWLFFASFLFIDSLAATEDVKQEIMARCRESMTKYGATMVKHCVDRDIEAVAKLNALNAEHGPIVSACLDRMRKYGFAMVLHCSERDIEAEQALSNY